jgi:hypothetical protein
MPQVAFNSEIPLDQVLKGAQNNVAAFPLIGKVEQAFDSVGLMRGSFAPVGRAAVGFAVGTGIIYALNGMHLAPWAFDEYGNRRPFKYDDPENGTVLPWWAPGLGLAVLFGGFI